MDSFEIIAEMGHERVLLCSNREVGLRAIIAIHSTVLGPGLGGCRMWPYRDSEEALIDVLRLSRGMTYKAAAAGLNLGGAKAVILGDPKMDKSEALFRAFGRSVDTLGGSYITAEDVGTDMEDMEMILTETRWVTGVSPAHGGSGDPSPVTAYGVMRGIEAALKRRFSTTTIEGRSIAIQGLGSVGYHLAQYLTEAGAKVLATDIDPDLVEQGREELGLEPVPVDDIYDVDCEIFAPCALGAILNQDTIPRLRCEIVAGGANNQLAREDEDGRALLDRGILYAPDFVINAGGLINVYNEFIGNYSQERALRGTRGIYLNLTRVFEIAEQHQLPTNVAADMVAEERIATISKLGSRHWGRLLER